MHGISAREREKMANRTQKDAKSIKGTNPQYLVEKIIRTRIYDSKYWKEQCFGLSCKPLLQDFKGRAILYAAEVSVYRTVTVG